MENKIFKGIIYKITNIKNNKCYIGQTVSSLKHRIWQHKKHARDNTKKSPLYDSIRKHGWENFIVDQIDFAENREDLDKKEIYWIKYYNSTDKNFGYNISIGGQSHTIIDIEKCIFLFKNGWNITAIAKEFNYDHSNLMYRLQASISKEEYANYIKIINEKKLENNIKRCYKENIKINHILPYIEKNLTFEKISKILGCSRGCIISRLKEYYGKNYKEFTYDYRFGSRKSKGNYLRIKVDIDKIIQLKKENKTFKEIAKKFNCSVDTVMNRLEKYLGKEEYSKISKYNFKKVNNLEVTINE